MILKTSSQFFTNQLYQTIIMLTQFSKQSIAPHDPPTSRIKGEEDTIKTKDGVSMILDKKPRTKLDKKPRIKRVISFHADEAPAKVFMCQKTQYTKESINIFQKTFGSNYMSAGGEEMTLKTARKLEKVLLARKENGGAKILDVGFGIGGPAFHFYKIYGAHVHGIDINDVGVDMANRELKRLEEETSGDDLDNSNCNKEGSIKFEVMDICNADFPEESYDIIYSRDTMVHLSSEAKDVVFTKFHKWLTPGGMVCIGDYCLGQKSYENGLPSPNMIPYLKARGYHMLTPVDYSKRFIKAGFDSSYVDSQDMALWYCSVCQREIDTVLLCGVQHDEFIEAYGEKALKGLKKTYDDKIAMTLRGHRSYVLLTATKTAKYTNLRQSVCNAYKTLSKTGQIMSCDGNVSVRATDDTYLITPTGVMIPDLTADKIVLCSNETAQAVEGETYKPSSETTLHNLIYQHRPDVGAIVHSHSIYACALACCRVPLPPAHYAVCELLQPVVDFSSPQGGSTTLTPPKYEDMVVKCTPYHTYGSKALGRSCLTALGKNYAVFLANHGAVVVGSTMEEAMYNSERLERECEIYWRSLQLSTVGRPQPLNTTEIENLNKRDKSYGQ